MVRQCFCGLLIQPFSYMLGSTFSTLSNLHTYSRNGCTRLHPQQRFVGVLLSPVFSFPQHLLFVLLMTASLNEMTWSLRVALISIFLMANNVEHF